MLITDAARRCCGCRRTSRPCLSAQRRHDSRRTSGADGFGRCVFIKLTPLIRPSEKHSDGLFLTHRFHSEAGRKPIRYLSLPFLFSDGLIYCPHQRGHILFRRPYHSMRRFQTALYPKPYCAGMAEGSKISYRYAVNAIPKQPAKKAAVPSTAVKLLLCFSVCVETVVFRPYLAQRKPKLLSTYFA